MKNNTDFDPGRRNFLKNTLGLTALGISELIPFRETLANMVAPERGVKDSWLETMEGLNMPEGFSIWRINASIDDEAMTVGRFFSIDDTEKGKVDIFTKAQHRNCFDPEIKFDVINRHYQNHNRQPVIMVAGTYTDDWKKEGDKVLEYGKASGKFETAPYDGLLVIRNGRPEITSTDSVGGFDAFTQKALINKWSQFQQISVIKDGNIDMKPTNLTEFEWRFFVEMKAGGQTNYGIINLHKRMTLKNAIQVLDKLGRVENALLLDTGALSTGYFYDSSNKPYLLTDEGVTPKYNGYTNLLVMYSEN